MTDLVTIARDRLRRAEAAQQEALLIELQVRASLQDAVISSDQASREVEAAELALGAAERQQRRAEGLVCSQEVSRELG